MAAASTVLAMAGRRRWLRAIDTPSRAAARAYSASESRCRVAVFIAGENAFPNGLTEGDRGQVTGDSRQPHTATAGCPLYPVPYPLSPGVSKRRGGGAPG